MNPCDYCLCPELLFLCISHCSTAFRTGVAIPSSDAVAATAQTKTAYLRTERRCYVADDSTNHQILNRVAVGARYRRDMLSEESFPFIRLRLISAFSASVFPFPSHYLLSHDMR